MKRVLTLVSLGLLAAAQANATVMDTWSRLSLQFVNLGRAEAAETAVGLSTVTTTAGGHLETIDLGLAPGLSINTVLPITDPIVSNGGIVEVRLTSVKVRPDIQGGVFGNVSGAIAGTGVVAPNTVPITGSVRICLVTTGCLDPEFTLALDLGGSTAGVGVGGVLTIGGSGTVMISIIGAPFTVKTVTAFNRTNAKAIVPFAENGFAHGPVSATSSTGLTSGVIQFVSATQAKTVGIPGNSDIQGNMSRTLIHFVPEPGLFLLFGAGALGMACLGRARSKL